MKGTKFIQKAVMTATALGAATLIGCGGSSRTPVSIQEVDIAGTFNAAALPRGASAASNLYTAVAVDLSTNATITSPVSAVGAFNLRLNRARNYSITFVCQTCVVKVVRLRLANANGIYLSKLNSGVTTFPALGNIVPAAPPVGVTSADGTPANDPTSNTATIWGTGQAFTVIKSSDSTIASLDVAAGTSVSIATALVNIAANAVDLTPPTITNVSPAPASSQPGTLTEASVVFSELMTETTAPNVTVTITNVTTGAVVQAAALATSIGTVAWSKDNTNTKSILTFNLTNGKDLTSGNNYKIALAFGGGTSVLKDLAGNPLSLSGITGTGITVNTSTSTIEIAFGATGPDTTAPTIVSTSPAANGTVSTTQQTGSVTFSEAMNTIDPAATVTVVNVTSGGTTILNNVASTTAGTGSWSADAKTFTFTLASTPARAFNAGQQYQVSLTISGFEDPSGNDLSTTLPSGTSGVNVTGNVITYTFTAQ